MEIPNYQEARAQIETSPDNLLNRRRLLNLLLARELAAVITANSQNPKTVERCYQLLIQVREIVQRYDDKELLVIVASCLVGLPN